MRLVATLLFVLASAASTAAQVESAGADDGLAFTRTGHTVYGDWSAEVTTAEGRWRPGQSVSIGVSVTFADAHLAGMAAAGIRADKLCVLVTAERTFDAEGWMRLPSDERMSTLLTPTGLAIEGGVQGAVTTRFGYQFRSPLDQLAAIPVAQAALAADGSRTALYSIGATLPADLPPGLYRLRIDLGVVVGTRLYNFNGFSFAQRPSSDQAGTRTYFYSPVIPSSGTHVSGSQVASAGIRARIPWLLLSNYNSNGYRGVIADEDRHRFATSDRSLIPDEVILPMFDDAGSRVSYSLEPQFPADTIDALQNIAWSWASGALSVRITGPDGAVVDLGAAAFVAKAGNGPTTRKPAFTAWKPALYGRYTVMAKGWIADESGRQYEGGGTFRFWIAKRMTLATATFQGMPYPVGSTYGRDIQFNPPFPARVQVSATLFVNSQADDTRTIGYSGYATAAGLFGASQGMKPFPLSAPGEYHAQILATHTDSEGHLWVSAMRHAGIVYPENGQVIARGKKLNVGGKYVERGDTAFEGYVDPDGTQHLAHVTFPYAAGDVLLIGSDGQGANKIEPVLTYQMQGDTSSWDTRLNGVGTTNLRIATSNGYSPHLYPEYITSLEYYYAAAPRPGFMGRFVVGESTVRAPYWPVSPNSFGNQIGASPNGDAPGDIYRLIGGVVLRRAAQDPMYSGYIASAFLLPRGSNNNRVIAAGDEDLIASTGKKGRFFLVALRPGSAFEVGATLRPAVQIDPLVPASIRFVMLYPDGRTQTAEGTGDRFGSFAGSAAWPLDVTGVYRYRVTGTWNGFQGVMPGLPDAGGEFYVYSKSRPAGASGLKLDGPTHRTFSAATGVMINGSSTAGSVSYALITPGAVIDQGEVPVRNGRFEFVFNPASAHSKVPLYDIVNNTTGKPQIGRVVHLTFFSREKTGAGEFYDFARVVLRGTVALLPGSSIPAAIDSTTTSEAGAVRPGSSAPGARPIAATDARGIREWDEAIERLKRGGDLRLVRREADTMLAGTLHERLQQYYKGIPVFGADVTRQLRGGVTVAIFGSLRTGIALEASPALDPEDARTMIELSVSGETDRSRAPSLGVLPLESGGYALSWQAEARTRAGREDCFLDAVTGEMLMRYPAGHEREFEGLRPGDARQAIAAVSAFYAGRFGRPHVDVDDRLLVSAASLQLVAHVMTHAVTDVSSGLVHKDDASDLDEAFSEMIALAVNRYEGHSSSTTGGRAFSVAARYATDAAERRQLEEAFYRAFVYMLPSNATFGLASAATLQSVRDLLGDGSALERAVRRAWEAAGVK